MDSLVNMGFLVVKGNMGKEGNEVLLLRKKGKTSLVFSVYWEEIQNQQVPMKWQEEKEKTEREKMERGKEKMEKEEREKKAREARKERGARKERPQTLLLNLPFLTLCPTPFLAK